jgi:hypothetical protein
MRSYVARCWQPSNSGAAPEMAIEPFVLIVADHDNRIFSVEGPMVDDNPWSKPVVDAQEGGKRDIGCFVPGGPARHDVDIAARGYQRQYDYARVDPGSVVRRRLW